MWKPKSPYWPVDKNGTVVALLVQEEDGAVLEFAGTLTGFGYRRPRPVTTFVLAWRRNSDEVSFMVYSWAEGQQERIGLVRVSDVQGLDEAARL